MKIQEIMVKAINDYNTIEDKNDKTRFTCRTHSYQRHTRHKGVPRAKYNSTPVQTGVQNQTNLQGDRCCDSDEIQLSIHSWDPDFN